PGNHLRLQHAAGREAEEDVGAVDDFAQGAGIGLLGVAGLDLVHFLDAAFIDQALDVGNPDVARRGAEHDQQVEAGQGGGTGPGGHDLDRGQVLADQVQAIEDGGTDDDRRAVLVIVEDGNLHPLTQLLLDVEALGGFDVFEVDAAESRFERGDDVDQFVRVAFLDLEVEDVDIGEFLEQHALAFHDRLGGERTDRPQAEDGGAVGDDADQVGARGQGADFGRIGDDFFAGESDARRVGHRQIVLVGQLFDGGNRNLARLRVAVVIERGFAQLSGIHVCL